VEHRAALSEPGHLLDGAGSGPRRGIGGDRLTVVPQRDAFT